MGRHHRDAPLTLADASDEARPGHPRIPACSPRGTARHPSGGYPGACGKIRSLTVAARHRIMRASGRWGATIVTLR
jgi:hypothetical protein